MSNDDGYDDDDQDDTQQPNALRAHVKNLEAKLKLAEAGNAEGLALKKESIFRQSGLDLESPVVKIVMESYKGDMTVEAVRVYGESLNLVTPLTDPLADDKVAFAAIGAANRTGERSPKPVDYETQIDSAKSPAEAMALYHQARSAQP